MAWPRLLLLLLALSLPGLPALADEAPERRVQLLYTGFTGGLSSARVNFAELEPLFRRESPPPFRVGEASADNVFRHGDYLLFTPHGPLTLADFRTFFSGPVEVHSAGEQALIATEYAYILSPRPDARSWLLRWLLDTLRADGGYPDASQTRATRFELMNRAGLRLSLLSLSGSPPPTSLLESPTRWEMLPARSIQASRSEPAREHDALLAVGRPLGDGLRRAWLLRQLKGEAGANALTVDAGNLLDPGFSELSVQQREFTFLQLGQLGYDALVPGETELLLEQKDWQRLSGLVPIVATNLKPADPAANSLPGTLVREINGLRIAIVGIVDDRALTLAGAAGPKTRWRVSDPIAAAEQAVAALAPASPDAIWVVTNLRDERLHKLRHVQGVTAVVGDFDGLPGATFDESVRLNWSTWRRMAVAYMIAHSSPNRVGRLEATFDAPPHGRSSLLAIRNESRLVTDGLPFDEAWRYQLNLTLERYQRDRQELLLPDLRDVAAFHAGRLGAQAAHASLDERAWSALVANVVRRATGAEVAVSRQLPRRETGVGPLSQLAVEGGLEVGDRVIQTLLSGKALRELAARDSATSLLAFAGYDPASGRVNGHPLDDEERYRVTSTDQVARHELFEETFAAESPLERWLRHPDGRAEPYAEGERTTLRDMALSAFRGLKRRHGGSFGPSYMAEYVELLAGSAGESPLWTLRLDDAQLLVNANEVQNNQAFSEVRNTRVTAPDSFAVGGKGRLSTVYDSRELAWENRVKSIYKRQTLDKEGTPVTQETDDEVVLTSEFRLKFISLPLANATVPLIPFVNSNYATEFTPQGAKPRRSEINAVGGLVLYPGWGLKELRAGAVLKNDLANPGFLEPGLMAQAIVEQALPGPVPAVLRGGFDFTRYLATPSDTPDRLGMTATLNAGLTVPLWDRFNFTLNADYFLFRGKVPATDTLGANLDFKAGIGYSLGFKPFYGVWF